MATNADYLAELNALLATETEKIAAESTVDDSIIALLASMAAANAALQAQILSLAIDPVVAQQIRDLFAANAAAQQANVDKVTAAVTANTPAVP